MITVSVITVSVITISLIPVSLIIYSLITVSVITISLIPVSLIIDTLMTVSVITALFGYYISDFLCCLLPLQLVQCYLKGQSQEIFCSIFFINQFILVPLEMSKGRFNFFAFSQSYCTFKTTPRYFGNRGVFCLQQMCYSPVLWEPGSHFKSAITP